MLNTWAGRLTFSCLCSPAPRHYRKMMMARMPHLNYLDDSPCFPKDRRMAVAFMEGGVAGERSMRETIRKEEDAERERHRKVRAFQSLALFYAPTLSCLLVPAYWLESLR